METLADRKKTLEGMKAPQLNELMKNRNIPITVGMTNVLKIEAILASEFPASTDPAAPAGTPPPPPAAPKAPPAAPKNQEKEPVDSAADVLDADLEALHVELLDRVKDVKNQRATGESAEAIRAGAVDFLKAANRVLDEARKLNESTHQIAAELSQQRQGIDRAAEDLNRRSEVYRRQGEQNVQQMGQIKEAQEALDKVTKTYT